MCLLQPFISQSFLLVTPVVAFLSPAEHSESDVGDAASHKHLDHPILKNLRASPSEVDNIFSFPLEVLLEPGSELHLQEALVDKGVEDWPYEEDYHVSMTTSFKEHETDAFLQRTGQIERFPMSPT